MPAERGHVKNRQKVSKIFSTLFDIFRAGGKKRQKSSKSVKNILGGTSAERSWHERFFARHEFSHEKCSEIFPEFFEPLFCGSEKIPQNSRQISRKISLPKIKKNHRRASAGVATLKNIFDTFDNFRAAPVLGSSAISQSMIWGIDIVNVLDPKE